ncbi:hypothetical protein O6H91_22G069800 [Diphasiastrum complanatum]|uniref:Uncharacterized protein n=1 Tax=Diphasiastrum complanatum TaxID=34168 RepID=A0ACC2AII7_DIPCM|nr:hypothetical protein O6H91_22G069800 [Diphasiastrum complanatum]
MSSLRADLVMNRVDPVRAYSSQSNQSCNAKRASLVQCNRITNDLKNGESQKRLKSGHDVMRMIKNSDQSTWWTSLFHFAPQDWSTALGEKTTSADASCVSQAWSSTNASGPEGLHMHVKGANGNENFPENTKEVLNNKIHKSSLKVGNFTADKARMLRQELRRFDSWHDTMYHSAIASRLASGDR